VYQNYLLVRPYPSLRITFTSPALRIPGLVQSRFMDRCGGPQHIREGILDALTQGVAVTAKVSWLTHSGGSETRNHLEGKPRWIHCTPLIGSDERVGVWMIVMIENEEITGSLNAHAGPASMPSRVSMASPSLRSRTGAPPTSDRYGTAKLYAQYLREGRAGPSSAADQRSRIDSTMDARSMDRSELRDPDEGVLEF